LGIALTESEKDALEAFLKMLTNQQFVKNKLLSEFFLLFQPHNMPAKQFLFVALIASTAWGVTACHNHDDDARVTITINQPTANQIFALGDSVIIDATITSEAELHGWVARVVSADGSVVFFENDKHTHGEELAVNTGWVNTVTNETQAFVEVRAELNHSGTKTKTEKVAVVLKKD
jgi:hypothetical protein